MTKEQEQTGAITTLFLDIGGVLLSNGWGHESRYLAAETFSIDREEMENRHRMAFDTYEMDKMSFDEYLNLTAFYKDRDFSKAEFKAFIFKQSKALGENIAYFKALKAQYNLKVIAVSNEGRDINEYRIEAFQLDSLFDAYISSCYVQLHKPDQQMLKMACDISHTKKEQALYIDDQQVLVDVARLFGVKSCQFTTVSALDEFLKTVTFHLPSKTETNAATTI